LNGLSEDLSQQQTRGEEMTEEDKAVEKVLDEIVANILKWQNRKIELDGRCCPKEREKGFQEGLRLGGALVRAHYIQVEEEETE
jgi:hypothetical protein